MSLWKWKGKTYLEMKIWMQLLKQNMEDPRPPFGEETVVNARRRRYSGNSNGEGQSPEIPMGRDSLVFVRGEFHSLITVSKLKFT